MKLISFFYNLLWGDLFTIPLPGGSSLGRILCIGNAYETIYIWNINFIIYGFIGGDNYAY